MGFKALMSEMQPEELYEATLGQIPLMIERSTGHEGHEWTQDVLHSAVFSDTLFLWLQPDMRENGKLDGIAAVQDLCLVVSGPLARGMRRRIALRGAIGRPPC